MSDLAILGGKPARSRPFPTPNTIDDREKQAVMEVLESGVLSQFLGLWHADFFGAHEYRRRSATLPSASIASTPSVQTLPQPRFMPP
jgi:hypothetical protein